jgi:copper chaperone CopZ
LTYTRKGSILQAEQLNKYLIDYFKKRKEAIIMKKTYKIEVDCANCANLMEDATKKTDGVANAVVNFMTQKMTVEFEDGASEKDVMKNVVKNCKKVEDDCEVFL